MLNEILGKDEYEHNDTISQKVEFEFIAKDYRDCVSCTKTNGVFKVGVLSYIKELPGGKGVTLENLRSCGGSKFENLSDETLLTLVGLKVLKEIFTADKAKWKMVGAKAKKFVMKEMGLDAKKVDEFLQELDLGVMLF